MSRKSVLMLARAIDDTMSKLTTDMVSGTGHWVELAKALVLELPHIEELTQRKIRVVLEQLGKNPNYKGIISLLRT